MFVRTLFKLMADSQASDLFFTAGAPVQIKIKGELVPIDANVLDAATMKKIAYEAMTEEQVAQFERDMEINFSLIEKGVGSFRVNIFRQRGACGMVIRHIKVNIPTVEELQLPVILKELIMDKRGLILVVGATGSGKSILTHLIARLWDVTRGRITLDGVDVRDLRLRQLRQLVATAFEDPTLFSMSARRTLRSAGRRRATPTSPRRSRWRRRSFSMTCPSAWIPGSASRG